MDTLVSAHAQYLSRLRAVELEIEIDKQVFKGGVETEKPRKVQVIKWAKEGDRERIRTRYFVTRAVKDNTPNFLDFYNDGRTTKALKNWDPDNPQKLNPFERRSVFGELVPEPKMHPSWFVRPTRLLLQSFESGPDEVVSLSELVKTSARTEVVGKTEINGQVVWHLRVHRAIPSSKLFSYVRFFDIYLSPRHNFAISKVTEHVISPEGQPSRVDQVVESYTEVGKDLYMPALFANELDVGDDAKTVEKNKMVIRDVVVNRPLSPDAFNFKFPEHCWVAHIPHHNYAGDIKNEIWGPDNKPKYEIHTDDDLKQIPGYDEWAATREIKRNLDPPDKRVPLIWYLVFAAVPLLFLLFLLRNRFRQRTTSE